VIIKKEKRKGKGEEGGRVWFRKRKKPPGYGDVEVVKGCLLFRGGDLGVKYWGRTGTVGKGVGGLAAGRGRGGKKEAAHFLRGTAREKDPASILEKKKKGLCRKSPMVCEQRRWR